jgi:hypothetical protein
MIMPRDPGVSLWRHRPMKISRDQFDVFERGVNIVRLRTGAAAGAAR